MQRMWRQMFLAVAGLLVVAGTVAAQSAPPKPLPPLPPLPAIPLAPDLAPAKPAAAGVVPTAGGFNGDVSTSGAGVRGTLSAVANQPPIQSAQYGPGCANGCGNCKSDLGFMFGSCKSFFDPCGPVPCNGPHCGKARFGCKPCGIHPLGQPYGTVYNGCVYDSYLNH